MQIETVIHLNKFKPRLFQKPIFDALDSDKYKRVMAVWPRRAGKDVTGFNVILRKLLKKVGTYYYVFPTFAQGRKILWDGIQNDGSKLLDYIPKELITSTNASEMKIVFKNGSLFQIIGSDNFDNSLIGTNPRGIVFSEFALQDERAWKMCIPILRANDGWALFLSTPRGHNHLYDLYGIALNNPESWFVSKLTVVDTGHISLEDIDKERHEGIMSEDLIQQEYFTSWDMGVEGSYYSKYVDYNRIAGYIGDVPWQSHLPVYTVWDLGVKDSTCIIFFQKVGETIYIIDCYDKTKVGLEHYIAHVKSKPYMYDKHIAPHDIRVQEWGSGITRHSKAYQLGVTFEIAPDVGIMDGIETVRSTFNRLRFDQERCGPLIRALENYRQEFDVKNRVYKGKPLHNWASDYADCLRYLCISLPRLQTTTSGGGTAMVEKYGYGAQNSIPNVFKNPDEQFQF